MNNELLLLAGNDIPFPQARVTIHQPTLKEIGYIGEETFFIGCGFLDFTKDLLEKKDKTNLENIDDFDIFMTLMVSREKMIKQHADSAKLVLSLIFPLYEIDYIVRNNNNTILLKKDNEVCEINKSNFKAFKIILKKMFNLDFSKSDANKYNPEGTMAERIAEKFKKRQEQLDKIAKNKNKSKKIAILSRYASILAVGLQKDLNELMRYTVYQLYDEFQRFQLKVQWDAYIQARMAGAKDLEEVDNWMIDLDEQGQNKNKNKK